MIKTCDTLPLLSFDQLIEYPKSDLIGFIEQLEQNVASGDAVIKDLKARILRGDSLLEESEQQCEELKVEVEELQELQELQESELKQYRHLVPRLPMFILELESYLQDLKNPSDCQRTQKIVTTAYLTTLEEMVEEFKKL